MRIKIYSEKVKIVITFSIILLIYSSFLLFYLFDPNGLNQNYRENNPSETPILENYLQYSLEDDFLMSGIETEIKYEENLTFINYDQGGMTGYHLYFYNQFITTSNSRYLRIIHHLSITSLIEIIKYIKVNDTWVEQSIERQWRNPEYFNIFNTMDYNFPSNYIYDDLVVEQTLVETDHKWLDLGNYVVGSLKIISGYNLASIPIVNTNAKNAYFGVEEILNNTKIIQKVEKFVIRDFIGWEVFQCRLFGWRQITSKTYYLGNYILEAMNGVERTVGINFVPYNL